MHLRGPEGLKALVYDVWETTGMKGRIHNEQFDFRGAYSIDELIYLGKPVFHKAQELLNEKIAHLGPCGTALLTISLKPEADANQTVRSSNRCNLHRYYRAPLVLPGPVFTNR